MFISRIRLLVIAFGCLIAGPVISIRWFIAPPPLEGLRKETGVVRYHLSTHYSLFGLPRDQRITLIESNTEFEYLSWFPKADRLSKLVQKGDKVTIWSDIGKGNWVWQIEKDGEIVIPYSSVSDAVHSHKLFDLPMGMGMTILGLAAARKLYKLPPLVRHG